jgi:hypothetical protein
MAESSMPLVFQPGGTWEKRMWNLTLAELVTGLKPASRKFLLRRQRLRPSETETFFPRNATSDFKASADITNQKKVRRLAAVCSSFTSNAFQCFLPD